MARFPRHDPKAPRPGVQLSELEQGSVVVDLRSGEKLAEHQLARRVVMEVIRGRVLVECGGAGSELVAGTLVAFEPGERHSEQALTPARLSFELREAGFETTTTRAASTTGRTWLATAPDWVLCLAAIGAVLLVALLILLSGAL
jgi:hypothetical protein